MKILVINPNSDDETNERMKLKVREFVGGKYEVDIKKITSAPLLVSSYKDHAAGIPELMDMIQGGTEYDAFIIACHGDPNLDLAKEITDKPVVGIAEASMKFASMYGNGFAVISPSEKSISKKRALARKYYCEDLLVTIRVSKSNENEDLYEAARCAVEEEHVDGIVLGCANYVNADWYIEQKLHIPVYDGLACALIIASGMAEYRKYKDKYSIY